MRQEGGVIAHTFAAIHIEVNPTCPLHDVLGKILNIIINDVNVIVNAPWRVQPIGEAALLLAHDGPDPDVSNRAALALSGAIVARAWAGVHDVVPAINTVLLRFDPLQNSGTALAEAVAQILVTAAAAHDMADARLVTIPVRYGGARGEDLPEVAAALGMRVSDVIAIHTAAPARVMMLGFMPGFPYLSGDARLKLPRRSTPRTVVPAGSVAIAVGLTGIYPARSPGGWHVIGCTEIALFDPAHAPPTLLQPGDRVQFVAIEA